MKLFQKLSLTLIVFSVIYPATAQDYVVDGYASTTAPSGMPFHAANQVNAFDADGIKLMIYGSSGADGSVQRLQSHQTDATFWIYQAIRATANGSACTRIIWPLQSRSDMDLIAKASTWSGLKAFVQAQKGAALHVVGGLDRPNTMFVEKMVAEHELGTKQQNVDGSEEVRGLFFIRSSTAALVSLAQPWASGIKHVEGVSVLENGQTKLLQGTATDGLAVRCEDLKPGSPKRELHKKVLRVIIKEARWLKDPENKSTVLSWIEANLKQRNMIGKIEANRGDARVAWKTDDPLRELAEDVYASAIPAIADTLPADALERERKTIALALGKGASADVGKFVDLSLAQEVQDELARNP